ncbi:SPOR domain-containing protein [Marinobacter sp. 1Y8]
MKRVVVVVLLLNLVMLWMVNHFAGPGRVEVEGGYGSVPRVSGLKLPLSNAEGEGSPPRPSVVDDGVIDSDRSRGELCGRIEGFDTEAEAETFAAGETSAIFNVHVDDMVTDRASYHWVLIPPYKTREAALGSLERLQRAGVDSYLVTEGEYKNGISLGLFESERLAQSLNARFQSKNIETVLVNMDKNQISYALVFEAGSQLDAREIEQWLGRYSKDLKLVQFAACEGVATVSKNP